MLQIPCLVTACAYSNGGGIEPFFHEMRDHARRPNRRRDDS